MEKNKQYAQVILLILVLGSVFYWYRGHSNQKEDIPGKDNSAISSKTEITDEVGKRNDNILSISLNVLNALNSYYLATITYPDEKKMKIF